MTFLLKNVEYLLYFSCAFFQRDIQLMSSSSCNWWSCLKLPLNRAIRQLCSRCSIICGCWSQWMQICSFLIPHFCRASAVLHWPLLSWFRKTHSPRGSTRSLSLGSVTEGSSTWWTLTTAAVAIGLFILQQCQILPPGVLSILVLWNAACILGDRKRRP